MRVATAVSAALLAAPATGHGSMQWPRPRTVPKPANHSAQCDISRQRPPTGGDCMWAGFSEHYMYNNGCMIGCKQCFGIDQQMCGGEVMQPTLNDPALRTYRNVKFPDIGYDVDSTRTNPWRAPGYAPVVDACGVMGGFQYEHPRDFVNGNGGWPPAGYGGLKGSELPESPQKQTWRSGGTAEVAWSVFANHGGGYQYRLCPKSRNLTEACFQEMPLQYASPWSWIQFGQKNGRGRVAFDAARVSEGVWPKGSTWTKNPIPPCLGSSGGSNFQECVGPQFEPPVQGMYGFGITACAQASSGTSQIQIFCNQTMWDTIVNYYDYTVVDQVKVPAGLKGEYVLSWRWDSEQTPQVWSNCADVSIV